MSQAVCVLSSRCSNTITSDLLINSWRSPFSFWKNAPSEYSTTTKSWGRTCREPTFFYRTTHHSPGPPLRVPRRLQIKSHDSREEAAADTKPLGRKPALYLHRGWLHSNASITAVRCCSCASNPRGHLAQFRKPSQQWRQPSLVAQACFQSVTGHSTI